MSERRMFSKSITESDAFLDMSFSAQSLYFHLSLNADDEGFINNSKRVMRICGFEDKDLKELLDNSFLIDFDSGIFVIKHWKINNKIRGDRVKSTNYPEEKSLLVEKSTGVYTKIDRIQCAETIENEVTKSVTEEKSTTENKDFESNDNEEIEYTKEDIERNEKIQFDLQNKPRKDYAEQVFDVLFANNLPCANNNLISFCMRDFKLALPILNDLHLHSDDVIQAVKNYAEVVKLKREGKSWWSSEQTFFNFCDKKTILQFIPENYKGVDAYRKDKNEKPNDDTKICL